MDQGHSNKAPNGFSPGNAMSFSPCVDAGCFIVAHAGSNMGSFPSGWAASLFLVTTY